MNKKCVIIICKSIRSECIIIWYKCHIIVCGWNITVPRCGSRRYLDPTSILIVTSFLSDGQGVSTVTEHKATDDCVSLRVTALPWPIVIIWHLINSYGTAGNNVCMLNRLWSRNTEPTNQCEWSELRTGQWTIALYVKRQFLTALVSHHRKVHSQNDQWSLGRVPQPHLLIG